MPKIKVGILLDSLDLPAWQYCLLEHLLAAAYVSVQLEILSDTDTGDERASEPGTIFKRLQSYERARETILPDACEIKSTDELLNGVERVHLSAASLTGVPRPDPAVVGNIGAHALDVIIALGAIDLVDALSPVARYGVWFFSHDYGQTCSGDGIGVGFWEVIKRRPYIRSALAVRRANASTDLVAYESFSGVHHTSHARSRNEHLWKIFAFVPRALQRLYEAGEPFIHSLPETPIGRSSGNAPRKWRLTNAALLPSVTLYVFWRLWLKVAKRFFMEKWVLLFNAVGETDDLSRFTLLAPPRDRFWADPFVVQRDGAFYVFIEDASLKSGHGHLAVMRIESDGRYAGPIKIIDKPYHLSYPFVFEWQDELFLIPESAANRTIELYRCNVFPYDWKFAHNLMEGVSAYDATLLENDGIWWMFANIRQHAGASTWDELCIFYSDSPISRSWRPHPLNPVISDVRRARPAGKIFSKDHQLYRPSQDSSHRYGYGLNFNEILELTATTYDERVVKTVEPTWERFAAGVHTFNRDGKLVVIDAFYRFPNLGRPGRQ